MKIKWVRKIGNIKLNFKTGYLTGQVHRDLSEEIEFENWSFDSVDTKRLGKILEKE